LLRWSPTNPKQLATYRGGSLTTRKSCTCLERDISYESLHDVAITDELRLTIATRFGPFIGCSLLCIAESVQEAQRSVHLLRKINRTSFQQLHSFNKLLNPFRGIGCYTEHSFVNKAASRAMYLLNRDTRLPNSPSYHSTICLTNPALFISPFTSFGTDPHLKTLLRSHEKHLGASWKKEWVKERPSQSKLAVIDTRTRLHGFGGCYNKPATMCSWHLWKISQCRGST
jgi:hypothetical protein